MQITRTGPLPKVMPVSLEILIFGLPNYTNDGVKVLCENNNKFTGGIPAEWSSMTNLKQLNMSSCGLDGGSWSLQIYHAEANREANRESPLNRVLSQTRQTPN